MTETASSDSDGDGTGDVTELRNVEYIVFADGTYDVLTGNFIPTASDDSITTDEDTTYSGTLPTYTDIDGDDVTYSLTTSASNGTVVVNSDGTYTYTPDANYSGTDSFTYTIDDGNGGTNTYTVTVTVEAVADTPTLTTNGTTSSSGDDLLESVTIADSIGLLQEIYNSVGSGSIDSDDLASTINGLTADSSEIVSQPYSTGSTDTAADDITTGTVEVTSGLIYLEAGTTISFSGYFDDSFSIILGGTTLISTTEMLGESMILQLPYNNYRLRNGYNYRNIYRNRIRVLYVRNICI